MTDTSPDNMNEFQLLEDLADYCASPLESDDALIDELAAMDEAWINPLTKLPTRPSPNQVPKV